MNSSEKSCNCKHIKGVHCSVKNCIYNDESCYCKAGEISVAPSNATTSTETACATFKCCDDTCH